MGDPRSSRAWKRICQTWRARATHCALCGGPIDLTLRAPHPASFTVDHIIDVDIAPELALDIRNTRPAHWRCNTSRGARNGNRRRRRTPVDGPAPSRAW